MVRSSPRFWPPFAFRVGIGKCQAASPPEATCTVCHSPERASPSSYTCHEAVTTGAGAEAESGL